MICPVRSLLKVFLASLTFGTSATAMQDAARGPFPVRYEIDAIYRPSDHAIQGNARVTFINRSRKLVDHVPFYLHPNSYSDSDALWVRRSMGNGAKPSIDFTDATQLGTVRVSRVERDGRFKLNDQTRIEGTRLWVALEPPLPPGESVRLDFEFLTKLPEMIQGIGYWGPHIRLAHWFPTMAAFVDEEWVTHDEGVDGHVFANFAQYNVSITLPADYEVATSGVILERETVGESQKIEIEADGVREFTLVANPHFERIQTQTGRSLNLQVMALPYTKDATKSAIELTERTLERLADWFGPWIFDAPLDNLTLETAPWDRTDRLRSMSIISMPNNAPSLPSLLEDRATGPHRALLRGLVERIFFQVIASDPHQHLWLTDGICTYIEDRLAREIWPPTRADLFRTLEWSHVVMPAIAHGLSGPGNLRMNVWGVELGPIGLRLDTFAGFPVSPFGENETTLFGFIPRNWSIDGVNAAPEVAHKPSLRAASHFGPTEKGAPLPPNLDQAHIAAKAALIFHTIEGQIGWTPLLQLIRAYVERHAFSHPTTADFFNLARELLSPRDLELFESVIASRGVFDLGVAHIEVRRADSGAGLVPQNYAGDKTEIALAASQEVVGGYVSQVTLVNYGDFELPTEVELSFSNGDTIRREWDGVRSKVWTFGPSENIDENFPYPLISAVVDPDRKIALDINCNNNGYELNEQTEAIIAMKGWSTLWIQNYLTGFSFLW